MTKKVKSRFESPVKTKKILSKTGFSRYEPINDGSLDTHMFRFFQFVCLSAKIEDLGRDRLKALVFANTIDANKIAKRVKYVHEACIIQKCNCVEAYVIVEKSKVQESVSGLRLALGWKDTKLSIYCGHKALLHLHRTFGSLESVVIGDNQVMEQMSRALVGAKTAGSINRILEALFKNAQETAKKIKSETNLHSGQASIERIVAGMLALRFADKKPEVLVVGVGSMGALIARLLHKDKMNVTVTSRNMEHLREFALMTKIRTLSWDAYRQHIEDFDSLIFVTSSAKPLHEIDDFTKEQIIFDLGNPPNIDGGGGNLFSIIDIRSTSQEIIGKRALEVPKAEEIMQKALDGILRKTWMIERTYLKRRMFDMAFEFLDEMKTAEEIDRDFLQKLVHGIIAPYAAALDSEAGTGLFIDEIFRIVLENRMNENGM